MTSIPVSFVSPLLAEVRDVNIAVPGTYEPGKQVNLIARFSSSMDVFPSKQRPKRFAIIGSNGREVWYLLKGHEDLRLDQRVVQLFSLINSFIPEEMPRIVTDFILPLSPKVGLIQWIPGSDTMFKLIREFRTARGMQTDAELRLIGSKSIAKIDFLRPIHRLELLTEVSKETPATVLASIMWLKASTAETWVRRVSTFSRTSGLMSVVGYLLGIGDRHTSNIMIHKYSGSVIHVDFGDCFESAKERLLFPELIPFRLTRFMVKAFGPSGIDGAFRKSCLDMIRLIRAKREVIISVLEIFAHAPLVRSKSNKASGISEDEYVAEITARINDKIIGMDFDSDHPLSPEEQVSMLIRAATDMYHMAHLFHGWKPLW
jgi:FKBP12-rapamycin complex-associated protein